MYRQPHNPYVIDQEALLLEEFIDMLLAGWPPVPNDDTDLPSPRWNEGLASFLEGLADQEISGQPLVDKRTGSTLEWLRAQLPKHPEGKTTPFVDYGRANMTGLSYSLSNVFFDLLHRLAGREAFNKIIAEHVAGRLTAQVTASNSRSGIPAKSRAFLVSRTAAVAAAVTPMAISGVWRQLELRGALTQRNGYRASVVASSSLLPSSKTGGRDGEANQHGHSQGADRGNRRSIPRGFAIREESDSDRVRGGDGLPPEARDPSVAWRRE